jgi:hypothetical protein
MTNWDKHFQRHSQMEVDFAPLGRLPKPRALPTAAIGSDFQDFRERVLVPSPYEEIGMHRGATRYPDYDPFGSEFARQSTDLPADVQDYLPGDPARNLKLKTSTDDFSGFGMELGPFASGRVSRMEVGPLEMVGPPPRYRPPPGPGLRERVVIGADVAPTKAPLWAKALGAVGLFLGGLVAERYIDKKLSHTPKRRSRR